MDSFSERVDQHVKELTLEAEKKGYTQGVVDGGALVLVVCGVLWVIVTMAGGMG